MACIKGLAHIGLFITDVDKSKKFYEDVLDFETIWECSMDDGTKIAFIKNGDLTLELVQFVNPKPDKGDGWVDHVAMAVEDIENMKKKLEDRGIKFEMDEIVFDKNMFAKGTKYILFRGPDNEHLEICEVI